MHPFIAMIVPLGEAPGQGNPPGTWGGANVPMPTPPIANVPGAPGGVQPPKPGGDHIWGGGNEPFPTPPIVIPPQKPGDPPLVIWGPNDPRPTPPINLPGGGNPPTGGDQVQLVEWHTAWSAETGWVVVGVPKVPHPAPSGQAGTAPPKA